MSARISARLTTSFLLMAIGFLAFLLLSASPASAHHREDHTTGSDKAAVAESTSTSTEAEGSETSGATDLSTGTDASSSTDQASTSSTSGSSSGSSSSGSTNTSSNTSSGSGSSSTSGNPGSTSKHTEKANEGISKHGFDPDPVQTQTPQATKGPTTCPAYDDGNAGPYDHSNCDGSQGLHGNGGNGKCAGCTGKADDKWPGGQYVGDHNNGYECDHNGGIGKGNPAHSRCATQQPPPPCVDNPETPMDECNPPPPCVDNPSTPQDECNPPQPCVDNPDTTKDECNPEPPKPPKPPKPPEKPDDEVGGRITPNVPPPPQRPPAPAPTPELPFTGPPQVGNFLWLALLLLGFGALLMWRTRDRGANA